MKSLKTFFISVIAIMSILCSSSLFAQDTLDVPPVYEDSPLGALNRFISANKPEAGQQRYFRLANDAIYFLSGTVVTTFDLNLIAADPSGATALPLMASGIKDDGGTVGMYLKVTGNLHLEGIRLSMATPKQTTGGQIGQVLKDSAIVEIIGCHFSNTNWQGLRIMAKDCKVVFKDNYTRNMSHPAGAVYNGRTLTFNNVDADTVIVTNNTFVNVNSFAFQAQNAVTKYLDFEHNTIVNTVKWPIQYLNYSDCKISNNIFYNANSYGETATDKIGQDTEELTFGIINTDTMGVDYLTQLGISEADRKAEVNNNYYYWSKDVKDYWAQHADSVSAEPFMNERTASMFADDAQWPSFIAENNVEGDINFTSFPQQALLNMIAMMNDRRPDGSVDTADPRWGAAADGVDIFPGPWPYPEDLSYPESDDAYKAAQGNFPVGNLNYFPEKKAQWIAWLQDPTDVKNVESNTLPSDFELSQNYPNPFNPSTTIEFAIPQNSNVKLSVHDILGREVAVLINNEMSAGKYSVQFNTTEFNLASGMYIYRMEAGNNVLTKKLLLLK